ncbi:MAG: type II toxin-antitoxin system HicB family antitoxin [Caldilineaceae bacterium]
MNQPLEKQGDRHYDVLDVLIEKNGDGYKARVLHWPDCVAQAVTREEVLQQVRMQLLNRLAKAELVTLSFTAEEINNPWIKFAGMWKDNPDFDEFQAAIQQHRRELDAELAPWLFEPEEDPKAEATREVAFV